VKVYEASVDAVASVRAGEGPVFIEFLTYRMRGHVGPNDNIQGTLTDIRPADEIERWRRRDPIEAFAAFATSKGLVEKANLKGIDAAVAGEVESAHRFAAASPRPDGSEIAHYVFRN
jgi:pyruvate dehydrogenase E1 component alpha subunit